MGSELINCKKCGKLFFANGDREICEDCFEKEIETIDKITAYVSGREKKNVTIDEIIQNTDVKKEDLLDYIYRRKLLKIISNISIRCRFCGVELDNAEKPQFVCKECLAKFAPETSQHTYKKMRLQFNQGKAKKIDRRLRGGFNTAESSERFGFIQNYSL